MKRILVLAAVLVTGCVRLNANCQPPALWQKPGATKQQFYMDKYVCAQQAQFNRPADPVGLNWESFNDCMKAAGYTPVDLD